jgi:hypothetical protein
MIQDFIDRYMNKKHLLRQAFEKAHPDSYKTVVRGVIKILSENHDDPDPERIHEIDDGNYQGTLVYVIGATGYQPSAYWYVRVYYGSCSGCDTLEGIRDSTGWSEDGPNEQQVDDYMTLALHIVQGLKRMDDESA